LTAVDFLIDSGRYPYPQLIKHSTKTKVSNLQCSFGIHKQIVWFNVPIDDFLLVDVAES
jgi:hypothetical protein